MHFSQRIAAEIYLDTSLADLSFSSNCACFGYIVAVLIVPYFLNIYFPSRMGPLNS